MNFLFLVLSSRALATAFAYPLSVCKNLPALPFSLRNPNSDLIWSNNLGFTGSYWVDKDIESLTWLNSALIGDTLANKFIDSLIAASNAESCLTSIPAAFAIALYKLLTTSISLSNKVLLPSKGISFKNFWNSTSVKVIVINSTLL